jgi:3-methyladenine DNA glycosylase Tag
LSYDRLYQDAVRDPRLVRTRQELEVAIDNARTARQIVWELFQDLEGFRLDEYKCSKTIELLLTPLGNLLPASESVLTSAARRKLVSTVLPDMLRRDLAHKGLLSDSITLAWRLLAWIEIN